MKIETNPNEIINNVSRAIWDARQEIEKVACENIDDRKILWRGREYYWPKYKFLCATAKQLTDLQNMLYEVEGSLFYGGKIKLETTSPNGHTKTITMEN